MPIAPVCSCPQLFAPHEVALLHLELMELAKEHPARRRLVQLARCPLEKKSPDLLAGDDDVDEQEDGDDDDDDAEEHAVSELLVEEAEQLADAERRGAVLRKGETQWV